jgi:hypothetical protein
MTRRQASMGAPRGFFADMTEEPVSPMSATRTRLPFGRQRPANPAKFLHRLRAWSKHSISPCFCCSQPGPGQYECYTLTAVRSPPRGIARIDVTLSWSDEPDHSTSCHPMNGWNSRYPTHKHELSWAEPSLEPRVAPIGVDDRKSNISECSICMLRSRVARDIDARTRKRILKTNRRACARESCGSFWNVKYTN